MAQLVVAVLLVELIRMWPSPRQLLVAPALASLALLLKRSWPGEAHANARQKADDLQVHAVSLDCRRSLNANQDMQMMH